MILLNTCAIREKASHKVYTRLGRLRRLKERNPDLVIGVAGCVAQLEGEAIFRRAPYVDLVLGPRGLSALPELLEKARRRRSSHLQPLEDSLTYPFETAVRAHEIAFFKIDPAGRCATFFWPPPRSGSMTNFPLKTFATSLVALTVKDRQARINNSANHGTTTNVVGDLGQVTTHPCPLARSKNDRTRFGMFRAHTKAQRIA